MDSKVAPGGIDEHKLHPLVFFIIPVEPPVSYTLGTPVPDTLARCIGSGAN